jgi:hypothetical protein
LKRLPICRHGLSGGHTADDDFDLYECCNPYHWSKLCKPGKKKTLSTFDDLPTSYPRVFSGVNVFAKKLKCFDLFYLDKMQFITLFF